MWYIVWSKVELALQFLPILPNLTLSIIFPHALRVVILNLVNSDIFQTDRRVLIQSANDLRRGDPASDDILPVFFELVVYIDGNHKRAEDAEKDEEVVHAQLAAFYLSHDWILSIICQFLTTQHLALLNHLQMLLPRRLYWMLKHVFSHPHLHI